MTKRSLHTLIDYLRRGVLRGGDAALTDAQLLERWTSGGDPAAFELLLWRHGPMVLRTCRRLLPRREDAEDAFQAAFLVLLRKAVSIRRREALAAWLHRVACRICLRMRTATIQRTSREQPLEDVPAAPHVEEPALSDLHAVLDEEIDRLPVHYRRALILCCLEGKTQEEAARLLACPRGTVSSWLTRGRERLRQRLLRRGIVVSIAGLAALAPDTMAMGGVLPLISSLIRVAGGIAPAGLLSCRTIALAEGMLRMMLMTKVKIVSAVVLVAVVFVSGAGTIAHSMRAADPPVASKDEERRTKNVPAIPPPAIPPKVKEKPMDDIAWGEMAHGLQAGIAFRPGDQTTYEVGQSVTFVVYLRNANVGGGEIGLSHVEALFEGGMLTVEDANGKCLAVARGPIKFGRVPIVHRTVEPGQQITLGYPWLRLRPLDWRGEVLGPTCYAAPGRYKVGFTSLVLRLNDGKDIGLGTKQVELDIRKAKAAKEDPAAKKPLTPKGAVRIADLPRLFYVSSRTMGIPVHISPKVQEQLAEIILLVSDDEGKTYEQIESKTAHAKMFHFHAPRDGTYWFVVQQVDKQGRCQPPNLSRVRPTIRISVDTIRPSATLKAILEEPNTIHLEGSATDANLEEKPITLEWAKKADGSWNPISAGPLANGFHYVWKLPEQFPARFHVRLRVRDKAGNETITASSSLTLADLNKTVDP